MHACRFNALIFENCELMEARGLRCKCWHCDQCVKMRCAALKELAQAGHPTKFITLTAGPELGPDPAIAAQRLVKAWRAVVQRFEREHPENKIEFLAVFEATKKGMPHLHIVARAPYIDQAWLSSRMQELAGSPICDVRAIGAWSRAAAYVAKYVSKLPWRWEGTKRYWTTRKYRIDPEPRPDNPCQDNGHWRVKFRFWVTLGRELEDQGYVVDWSDPEKWSTVMRPGQELAEKPKRRATDQSPTTARIRL